MYYHFEQLHGDSIEEIKGLINDRAQEEKSQDSGFQLFTINFEEESKNIKDILNNDSISEEEIQAIKEAEEEKKSEGFKQYFDPIFKHLLENSEQSKLSEYKLEAKIKLLEESQEALLLKYLSIERENSSMREELYSLQKTSEEHEKVLEASGCKEIAAIVHKINIEWGKGDDRSEYATAFYYNFSNFVQAFDTRMTKMIENSQYNLKEESGIEKLRK